MPTPPASPVPPAVAGDPSGSRWHLGGADHRLLLPVCLPCKCLCQPRAVRSLSDHLEAQWVDCPARTGQTTAQPCLFPAAARPGTAPAGVQSTFYAQAAHRIQGATHATAGCRSDLIRLPLSFELHMFVTDRSFSRHPHSVRSNSPRTTKNHAPDSRTFCRHIPCEKHLWRCCLPGLA